MDSTEKYEIIGKYIYTFGSINGRLVHILQGLSGGIDKDLLESGTEKFISEINLKLSNRGSELRQKFSNAGDEIYKLKNERDALRSGDIPDQPTMVKFVDRCADTLAKLAEIEALIENDC